DDDAIVRIYATTALAAAGEHHEVYLRLLMLAWRDVYDPEEPYPALPHVLEGIALLGPAAAAEVPRLLELLDRPPVDRFEKDYRADALRSLAGIGPAAKAAAPRLRALAATDGSLAAPAAEALRKIEGPGEARP